VINGRSLAWLDCKAFYGSSIPFNVKKMRKQTKKYIDHWGHGGVLFLQGYSEALIMSGCTPLGAYGVLDGDILSRLDEKITAILS
jgi:hypothetical protein